MVKRILLMCSLFVSGIMGFTPKEGIDKPIISGPVGTSTDKLSIDLSLDLSVEKPTPGTWHIGKIAMDYFVSPIYGPFKVGDPDFNATFTYRADIDNQQILERLRIFTASGELLNANTMPAKTYEDNALEEVTFLVPIRNCLSVKGITLKFEILAKSNRAILKTYSATIYPVSTPNNSYQYYRNNIYQSLPIGFYGDGHEMKSIKETISFSNLGDYLESDYYYRLDVKDKGFSYESDFPLTYKSLNLRFEDHENLFPYYTHDANDNVIIPLDIKNNRGRLSFKYKTNFYINKRTLETGDIYREGFIFSPSFYLPINGKERFDNKILYLDFVEFSKSKITFSYPLRYISGKAIVGTAPEGEYYVSGGIAND